MNLQTSIRVLATSIVAAILGPGNLLVAASSYHLTATISIPGGGAWDYAAVDSLNRRLYVSHASKVDVVDLATEKWVGEIPNTNGVHGIAIADDLGLGFITAGKDNQVVIFDLHTLSATKRVQAGANPDGIVYDPATRRVFAFNGRSNNATVIDATDGTVASTIELNGKPEFPVTDGQGSIFVNIEDRNEILHINSRTLKVEARWSIAPAVSPSGLAIDTEGHRLFSVCDGKVMVVLNYDSGQVVAQVPIGEGPDAAAYDPATHTAFSSNGEGTVTVVHLAAHDQFLASPVRTKKGARTMALDLKTHKLYLPSADYAPAPQPTPTNPHPRPLAIPGSFKILVLSP